MQQAIQKVKLKINSKYDTTFYFFLSKPINQIIYEFSSSQSTISFNDVKMFSKCQQYLKRFYYKITFQGVTEIQDRISMLGQFYTTTKLLKYQYPMMILTDTETIFRKRARRLKKILAQEGSSDDTQENNSIYNFSLQSQNFLKDLSSVEFGYLDQSHQKNHYFSFDSSVHDIYGLPVQDIYYRPVHNIQRNITNEISQMQQQQQQSDHNQISQKIQIKPSRKIYLSNLDQDVVKQYKYFSQENELTHLIVNFQSENDKSDKISIKNRQSLKNILNIQIQKEKNIQGHQKQRFQQNLPNKTKKHFVGSFLKMFQNAKHRKNVFDYDFAHNLLEFKASDLQNNKLIDVQRVDEFLEKQKQERLVNRRKIRQKAQQLLRKVRNQQKTIKTYDLNT